MSENLYNDIPASKFQFVPAEGRMHDKKLETKPIGYFRDAFNRFCRNKGSVVAAIIILILVLYSVLVPIFCENKYTLSLTDTTYLQYAKLPPRSSAFSWLGVDGMSKVTVNQANYLSYCAMGVETGMSPVKEIYRENYVDPSANKNTTYYDLLIDNYYKMGMMFLTLSPAEYEKLQAYQDETGLQVIYPALKDAKQTDANIWYEASKKGVAKLDKEGNFIPVYQTSKGNDAYHSIRIAADNDPDAPLAYARVTGTSSAPSYICRVNKYNYFIYRYGFEPEFIFGTNGRGQDIFTRLASGARFSFILAICVSALNLFIGAVYGAIEGYYGGWIDMTMERISDVLSGIPFMVVTTLFQLHLSKRVGVVPALLFAFVLTGWIGMASRVRMQFYRYKGQEFVLAARTLGASDRRLMFKHIFPNALGTIITGSVLVIPGVIFSESSLTYLGIVNLESSTMTSVGTMLANGKNYLSTDPYIIFFPAMFISLLEISFNLFGNGLRDAFNPSLRGAD